MRNAILRRPTRRYHVGAELLSSDVASFRVWAPDHGTVDVVVDGKVTALAEEADGCFSVTTQARVGARYGFHLDGDAAPLPDPASRSQPDGPLELSAVVDLTSYRWHDRDWKGLTLPGQVLYEMHVGTYTEAGTFRAAADALPRLRDLGVTAVQLMPVAEFAGACGWGYDGVQWFAPMHTYGAPADLQHFVDTAHRLGLGVILDVVYNHLGPAGNVMPRYASHYVSRRHENEWGDPLNFDGPHSQPVRDLVLSNVAYWITEFHVDGFRLDAAQQIHDASDEHLLAAVARTARAAAAPRDVVVLAEHEPQHARLMRPVEHAGYGLDGVYNEDFHHSMRVALTGTREAYLSDYTGTSREWLAAVQRGFLFQGQYFPWQSAARGAPALDRLSHQFVCFLENHDQVANGASGQRLVALTSASWWRAMSALLLLGPWTPLLFQGQESATQTPFLYFADHAPDLQAMVVSGRKNFLTQFSRCQTAVDDEEGTPDMGPAGFRASRLDHVHTPAETRAWTMYRDLLTMRRQDPGLRQPGAPLSGATLSDQVLLLRPIGLDDRDGRLIVVNLGADIALAGVAEPLLAPPEGKRWAVMWSSEQRRYGGCGLAACVSPERIFATGHATTIFHPLDRSP